MDNPFNLDKDVLHYVEIIVDESTGKTVIVKAKVEYGEINGDTIAKLTYPDGQYTIIWAGLIRTVNSIKEPLLKVVK